MATSSRTRIRSTRGIAKGATETDDAVEPAVWQLKITLRDVKPPVWRRIQVPASITLAKLHLVVQAAMGWENYHLYSFSAGGTKYGEPDPELQLRSARSARLNAVAPGPRAKLQYTYDFGDSWEHDIVVEKALASEPGVHYPMCVAAKRACPPEDCGGAWGYEELLDILGDPEHEEYEERLEWAGGTFDPEAFDLDAANAALRRLR